jgi:hypothetical protein
MVSIKALLSGLFIVAVTADSSNSIVATPDAQRTPAPPAQTFLYTSFVNLQNAVNYGLGPIGDRLVIPIVGGNFTGPKLNGTF